MKTIDEVIEDCSMQFTVEEKAELEKEMYKDRRINFIRLIRQHNKKGWGLSESKLYADKLIGIANW